MKGRGVKRENHPINLSLAFQETFNTIYYLPQQYGKIKKKKNKRKKKTHTESRMPTIEFSYQNFSN